MGLDWNPGPKAKPGCEAEFRRLWTKLQAKSCWFRQRKFRRFGEITTTAFETLATPRVGIDAIATKWAREEAYPHSRDQSLTVDEFVQKIHGFYVLELVPPCDGLPRYTNGYAGGYVEQFSFRGAFLSDCTEIIGEELRDEGYLSMLPEETADYGERLLTAASRFAAAHGIDGTRVHLAGEPETPEFRLDVVFSAGRWCRFWAERGHWLEAYW